MKIATWNVNSLRVRLLHVLDWLAEHEPDVLCLQETKTVDEQFPVKELEQAGYQLSFVGQKTYNGVAVLSKSPVSEIVTTFPGFDDPQKRVLAVTVGEYRVINLYIPNGSTPDSEKYHYKLSWLEALQSFLSHELKNHKNIIVLGDFNIAPEDQDVHDPEAWQGSVLVSPPERAAFQAILDLGFSDSFRLFEQEEKIYSWWDYRMMAFRRNRGLRIDHILISKPLISRCEGCFVDKAPRKLERPSDHAPVVALLKDS